MTYEETIEHLAALYIVQANKHYSDDAPVTNYSVYNMAQFRKGDFADYREFDKALFAAERELGIDSHELMKDMLDHIRERKQQ